MSKLQELYDSMVGGRSGYLERGQEYSRMSLPYILPQTVKSAGASNKHGFQGIGAEAVNHLANKLVEALFPIAEPFFTLSVSPELATALALNDDQGEKEDEILSYFNTIAEISVKHMNKLRMRPYLVTCEKHLLIAGNACLVFADNGVKLFGLDKFVVKRDSVGNVLKAVIREGITKEELTPDMLRIVGDTPDRRQGTSNQVDYYLYTGYILEGDEYIITQSIEDKQVMDEKRVPKEKCPAIFPRWNVTSGEDYGRGLMEDHSGDFSMVEFLSEARAKGAATMMDIKYLVKPGALTDIETLNNSPTGTFVSGMEGDIIPFQADKFADGNLIMSVLQEYTERISRAFSMLSASVRDSERTTKYEIQKLANDLDLAHGGAYSTQSNELQHPIAIQLVDMVGGELVEKGIEPLILTGLESLGKNKELEKLMQYTEMMMLPTSWAEPLLARVDWNRYSNSIAATLSLDVDFLISEEEMAQRQQAQQQAQGVQEEAGAFSQSMMQSAGSEMGKNMMSG